MTFRYNDQYNELDYFNKNNVVAYKEALYTTHFTINLPKKILYWTKLDNKFYYEYDSKQLITIYTSYKNEGKESDKWELKDMEKGSGWKSLGEYRSKRGYDEIELDKVNRNRITKLYTNGNTNPSVQYKDRNYGSFLEKIKSFEVK